MNDNGKYWRHVYKSLLLLDYMLKNGSEQVVRACLANVTQIRTLRQFQFVSELGKDEGQNVRQRAKLLVELLGDKDRLREERKAARKNATKYNQAISSDGWGNTGTDSFSGRGSGGGGGGGWDEEDSRGRSGDRSPRRGNRSDSRSPSPSFSERRRSPSPDDRRRNERGGGRDRDRRRNDSRSPSPSSRPRAPSGGASPRSTRSQGATRSQQAPQQQQQVQQQQQPSAASLLFDLNPVPASAPVQQQSQQQFGVFGSPPPSGNSSFGGFPPSQPAPSAAGSSFGSFPPQQSSGSSFGSFPPQQSSSSSLSFDFNPRATGPVQPAFVAGGNSSFVQQPTLPLHQQPSMLQPQQFQPQQTHQQQQQQEWASFSSFQGPNSQPANPGDIVSTNHHLFNLEQLSAPVNRGAPEKKKTLAELAAESNAQKQPVLQSAPRAAPLITPQYDMQMYQMQVQQQQRLQQPVAGMSGAGYVPQQGFPNQQPLGQQVFTQQGFVQQQQPPLYAQQGFPQQNTFVQQQQRQGW